VPVALLRQVEGQIMRLVKGFCPQDLSNTFWSLGTFSAYQEVYDPSAQVLECLMDELLEVLFPCLSSSPKQIKLSNKKAC
jgi:hypothetical protein